MPGQGHKHGHGIPGRRKDMADVPHMCVQAAMAVALDVYDEPPGVQSHDERLALAHRVLAEDDRRFSLSLHIARVAEAGSWDDGINWERVDAEELKVFMSAVWTSVAVAFSIVRGL